MEWYLLEYCSCWKRKLASNCDFSIFSTSLSELAQASTLLILRVRGSNFQIGGIISLALGANLWSAHKCVDEFKTLTKNSFRKLLVSSIPLVGQLALWTDSYYDKSVFERALKRTCPAPDGRPRFLLDEPYTSHQRTSTYNSTPSVRDIKLGVTTVNAMTLATTLITNYNRKTSNGGKSTQLHGGLPMLT